MNARKKTSPQSILMVSSEAAPYSKTGGLADMTGALAKALAARGNTVTLVTPLHRQVNRRAAGLRDAGAKTVSIPVSARVEPARLVPAAPLEGVRVIFVESRRYFDREGLYGGPQGDFPDNAERFAFFAQASLETIGAFKLKPDVIHVHDWQAALVPVYLAARAAAARPATVLTIHNLGYQGRFDPRQWHTLGLGWDQFYHPGALEFYGGVNFLKGGMLFADALTTVSPTYAREIQTVEMGWGLDGILRDRAGKLAGVLNGIDTGEWNPATDKFLPARYGARGLSGKAVCKTKLLEELGLEPGGGPLIAMVSRLVEQKGADLVLPCMEEFMAMDTWFALLGSGHKRMEEAFLALAQRYPGRVAVRIGYDEALSHRIVAGADLFLIPSRYEPCGLTQLYSLAYGTVPVARATGGLADTVFDVDPAAGTGNGFTFAEYSPDALRRRTRDAVEFWRANPAGWRTIMERGMKEDHSWGESAMQYERVYRTAVSLAAPAP